MSEIIQSVWILNNFYSFFFSKIHVNYVLEKFDHHNCIDTDIVCHCS